MTDKEIPRNLEAEESVIGSLLIDGKAIRLIAETLKPSDFYYSKYQDVYEACVRLAERHDSVNQITIAQELARQGKLEGCGGASHLSHLISICPTSLDIEHYAEVVKRLSSCRQMIVLGDKMAALGYEENPDTNDMIERGVRLYDKFRKANTTFDELINPAQAGNIMLDLINKYNQPDHSISWGFRDLDNLTAGIFSEELIIIGARTRVGKTQLMLDVATNALINGRKVLFASAEMSVAHILERRVARELGVSIKSMRMRGVDSDQMDKIVKLAGEISEQNLYFVPHGVSSLEIYHEAEKMQENMGLDLIFIDYLQKLKDCYGDKENENIRIGKVCQRVHDICLELGVPVICAAQFNRNLDWRGEDNKAPVISDLRGSGSIENDADVILLAWRDGPADPILNIKMAKSRQVEPGDDIKLTWIKDQHRYGDIHKGVEGC